MDRSKIKIFILIVSINVLVLVGIVRQTQPWHYEVFTLITQQIQNNTDKNDVETHRFLYSHPNNILTSKPPIYVPGLKTNCFYSKTEGQANKGSYIQPGYDFRCLPNVYLIGFSKSGTTDLNMKLTQHHLIHNSYFKEAHFWDIDTSKTTVKAYTEMFAFVSSLIENCCLAFKCDIVFPTNQKISDLQSDLIMKRRNLFEKHHDALKDKIQEHLQRSVFSTYNTSYCPFIVMDSTPSYVWKGHTDIPCTDHTENLTMERIRYVTPDAKFIVMMRRPEDRLWSDYNFFGGGKKTPAAFHRHVTQGIAWWERCVDLYNIELCAFYDLFQGNDNLNINSRGRWQYGDGSRVRVSVYVAYLKKWLLTFPRENFLFIRFEDYIRQPELYIENTVVPFLGLEKHEYFADMFKTEAKAPRLYNKNSHEESMRQDTRIMLQKFYEKYNIMLAKLLNDDKYLWNDLQNIQML